MNYLRFANLNKMSLEEVHKSRAMWLMNKLSAWNNDNYNEVDEDNLNLLEATLVKLEDLDFMVRCCINATLIDLKRIRRLLNLARTAIQNNLGQDLEHSLMASVSKALHRLDTFIFVHNKTMDKNGDNSGQVDKWIQFSRADMLDECQRLLSIGTLFLIIFNYYYKTLEFILGEVKAALIIWNRHQSEFSVLLNPQRILEILNCIPKGNNFSSNQGAKMTFLAKFLPDCLHLSSTQASNVLDILAKWICATSKALEAENRSAWPLSGIVFSQTMFDALHVQANQDLIGDEGLGGLATVRLPLLLQEHKHNKVRILKNAKV